MWCSCAVLARAQSEAGRPGKEYVAECGGGYGQDCPECVHARRLHGADSAASAQTSQVCHYTSLERQRGGRTRHVCRMPEETSRSSMRIPSNMPWQDPAYVTGGLHRGNVGASIVAGSGDLTATLAAGGVTVEFGSGNAFIQAAGWGGANEYSFQAGHGGGNDVITGFQQGNRHAGRSTGWTWSSEAVGSTSTALALSDGTQVVPYWFRGRPASLLTCRQDGRHVNVLLPLLVCCLRMRCWPVRRLQGQGISGKARLVTAGSYSVTARKSHRGTALLAVWPTRLIVRNRSRPKRATLDGRPSGRKYAVGIIAGLHNVVTGNRRHN